MRYNCLQRLVFPQLLPCHFFKSLFQMIREEFQRIEALGLEKPALLNLSEEQLQIWEIEPKQPTLQPGNAAGDLGASRISNRQWLVADAHIVFQRYLTLRL